MDEGLKRYFLNVYENQVDGIETEYADPETGGLWHTVINNASSYIEIILQAPPFFMAS